MTLNAGTTNQVLRSKKVRNLALLVEGGRDWIAGIHYLRNLLKAIKAADPATQYRPHLVLPGELDATECGELVDLAHSVIRRKVPSHKYRHKNDALEKKFWYLSNPPELEHPLGHQLRKSEIDCVFGIESFGPRFRVPLISWLYDFQHKDMPGNFSKGDRADRDLLFGRVAQFSDRIVVSSEHARSVYRKHYVNEGNVRVVHFAVDISTDVFEKSPSDVLVSYGLPERFFYLPNQFWLHKNHALAIEALALAVIREPEIRLVCSGALTEPRDPEHVGRLMQRVSSAGLSDNIRFLSLIPYSDVVQLMRQSISVVQPSLYEGWSTTVEECKALSKPVLLSRIDVHEEQSPPFGVFVDKHNPSDLAEQFIRLWKFGKHGPDVEQEMRGRADNLERLRRFGHRFLDVVDEVTSPEYRIKGLAGKR